MHEKCSIPIAISEFEQFLLHLQGCIRKRPHIEDEKNELDRVEQKSKEHWGEKSAVPHIGEGETKLEMTLNAVERRSLDKKTEDVW